MAPLPKTIVSLGGNALIRPGEKGAIEEQFANAQKACEAVSAIIKRNGPVIITHGNGPVVGNIVIRNEAAKEIIPPMPLYISDADSEGGIGFMIQQALYNELRRTNQRKDVVTLITQVVVDAQDQAFSNPTKPIGPFYSAEEAETLRKKGWIMAEDSFRGFRRVVPSPRPKRVVEAPVVKRLSEEGVIVIAAGAAACQLWRTLTGFSRA